MSKNYKKIFRSGHWSVLLLFATSPVILAGFVWEAAVMAFAYGQYLYVEMIMSAPDVSWKDRLNGWRFDGRNTPAKPPSRPTI